MVYLYQENEQSLILDRIKGRKVILRIQSNGYMIPVLKTSAEELSVIFSELFGKAHQHASRLDHDDTKIIINNIIGETEDISDYKPTCVMHYIMYLKSTEDYESVELKFKVFYHLWKRDTDEATGNFTFKDIITDELEFSFTILAEDYLNMLMRVCVKDIDNMKAMWDSATNAGFIMDSDYDFGDMDEEILEDVEEDYDFGES